MPNLDVVSPVRYDRDRRMLGARRCEKADGPSLLALHAPEPAAAARTMAARTCSRQGAPIACSPAVAARKVVLIATGSEVEIARRRCATRWRPRASAPTSSPCPAGRASTRRMRPIATTSCASPSGALRVSIEARHDNGLGALYRHRRLRFGIDGFGALGAGAQALRAFRPHRRGDRAPDHGRRWLASQVARTAQVAESDDHGDEGCDQRLRTHRSPASRARSSSAPDQRARAGRDQRPRRCRVECARSSRATASTARFRARLRVDGDRSRHRRQAHQGDRGARSGEPAGTQAKGVEHGARNAPASSPIKAKASAAYLTAGAKKVRDLGAGQGRATRPSSSASTTTS